MRLIMQPVTATTIATGPTERQHEVVSLKISATGQRAGASECGSPVPCSASVFMPPGPKKPLHWRRFPSVPGDIHGESVSPFTWS